MIAISENILREYIKFKKGNQSACNFKILEGFFKNFYPFVVSTQQLKNIGFDQKTILTLIHSSGKFDELSTRVVIASTTDELIEKSTLKLFLNEDDSITSSKYVIIDISSNNQVSKKFSSMYSPGIDRYDALKHIRSLLENSLNIDIYDKHMCRKVNFKRNISILKMILPDSSTIKLFVENENIMSVTQNDLFKQTLQSERPDLTIDWVQIDSNIHDRYIKAGSMNILLSSGLVYLKNKTKDLSYVINI